jgi:hypothetical protein
MPKLIHGKDLNRKQREIVLAAFGYRWTVDNRNRERWWQGMNSRPTVPLITDEEWLKKYSFYFTADGTALAPRCHFAEPYYGG